MERARFELCAANEIRLVYIDAERMTIGVDSRRRERQQVPAPQDAAGGDNQKSHLARFGINHDAVQPSEIAVVIVPDRDVSVAAEGPADRFRIEVAEPGVNV